MESERTNQSRDCGLALGIGEDLAVRSCNPSQRALYVRTFITDTILSREMMCTLV